MCIGTPLCLHHFTERERAVFRRGRERGRRTEAGARDNFCAFLFTSETEESLFKSCSAPSPVEKFFSFES